MLIVQAWGDLMRRYGRIFAAAWKIRHSLEPIQRTSHELAFLPASLELAETPLHPAPRWTMRTIALFAVIVLLITLIGRLDIVCVAKGKLVPTDRVKVVQPAITGVVKRIYVKDGQRVSAGDPLMELDATQAAADTVKAHASRISAALAAARAQAVLDAQLKGTAPVVPLVEEATPGDQADAQRFAEGIFREYQDKQAQSQAELDSTLHDIDGLKATAPLARRQAQDFKALVDQKYVAENDYLAKEQAALQQESDLASKTSHAEQLRDGLASAASQFRREQLDELDKATQQFKQTSNDETKAITREHLMSLAAPVSGTVQQMAIHTLGGVVTTAQSLMEIVPDDAVEVEATIANKDIGFVLAGQDAIVKVDAFPYTQYGYMTGVVRSVSNDAVQDKKQGLSFVAHIRLSNNRMQIKGQWIDLIPGMSVSAEIKTGKRSVIGYFLDPLLQTTQESLRER